MTVSYPYFVGKKYALKIALDCAPVLGPVAEYANNGENLDVTADVVVSAKTLFFALYGKKTIFWEFK